MSSGITVAPEELGDRAEAIAGKRLFVVWGNDTERREEAAARIARLLREQGVELEVADGEQLSEGELELLLTTGSLFARDRLVLLRRGDRLANPGRRLLQHLASLPPGVRVLICSTGLSARSPLGQLVAREGVSVPCEPLEGQALLGWIRARARDTGLSLAPRAAALLAELCGGHTGRIARELEKLACYPATGPLGEAELRRLVSPEEGEVEDRAVFQLADAIGHGRASEALGLVGALLRAGRPLVALLPTLDWYFRQVAAVAHAGPSAEPHELAAALGLRPQQARWQLERRRSVARRYTPAALARCFDALLQADRLLRSSTLPEAWLAERLVLSLLPDGPPFPPVRA